jgi:glucose-1-phosphate thymidylyltransferase
VEKPTTYVSDLAIIGIYFFKDGAALRTEMQYLIDHNIRDKGEFQFTSALVGMQKRGARFSPGEVQEWLDCGNKDVLVQTNSRYLEFIKDHPLVSAKAKITSSVIIPPCYIGDGAVIENCVIGPNVSIGESSTLRDSRVSASIIQRNTTVSNAVLHNSVLGNFVNFEGKPDDLNLGDYSSLC